MGNKKSKRKPTVIELDDVPRVALVLTDESTFLTRFDERGRPSATYQVASQAVASAFSTFGSDTGLLSLDTLFWQSRGGDTRLGVWLPPQVRTLVYGDGPRSVSLRVPLPGLVFAGYRADYYVWAAPRRPARESDPLYLAPFSNIYGDGRVCKGDAPFPRCEGAAMAQAVQVFFESSFNADLSGGRVKGWKGNLLSFWKSIKGKRGFPVARLAPAGLTMGHVLRGER